MATWPEHRKLLDDRVYALRMQRSEVARNEAHAIAAVLERLDAAAAVVEAECNHRRNVGNWNEFELLTEVQTAIGRYRDVCKKHSGEP